MLNTKSLRVRVLSAAVLGCALAFAGTLAASARDSATTPRAAAHPSQLAGVLLEKLSDLGLFTDLRSLAPAPGVFAYGVQHPQWTDGAISHRHAWLPPGSEIVADEDGAFTFPPGAVFAQTLENPDSEALRPRLETRVLYKVGERWEEVSYVWNEAEDDAVSNEGRETDLEVRLPGCDEDYVVPGRTSCLQCHGQSGDQVIGFAAWQLEAPVLDRLRSAGHLPAQRPLPHEAIEAHDPLERAALGYLAGNCAHCHNDRTAATVAGGLDLRHFRARDSLVGVRSVRLRHPSAIFRVAPGDPGRSVLYRLLAGSFATEPGGARMPPVGTALADAAGREILGSWIHSLAPETVGSVPPRKGD